MNGHAEHVAQVAELYSGATNPSLQMLINRLQHVHQRGDQYRAQCPVHEGRSTSSLSLRETRDGRILVHCFGGCSTLEILQVCGLEMADIMPERITHNATPEERAKWRQAASHKDWCEARDVIQHEARVVWIAGLQQSRGKPLSTPDSRRLKLALHRIEVEGRKLCGNA
jgi:hypothetical protein